MEEVENLCAELARQGRLIQVRGTATWPDATVATQFTFRHVLYQEILYNRVPAGRRLRWHQQIGTRLEAGYGRQAREIAAELAMHYVQGQMQQQAIRYLRYACDKAGEAEEGLRLIEEALTVVQRHDLLLYEGELVRLKGELMLLQADIRDGEQAGADATSRAIEAEACLHHALDLARRQGARCLELRVVMSLCRLWQRQHKPDQARALLSPVYGWFSEGLHTADLQEARALMVESGGMV